MSAEARFLRVEGPADLAFVERLLDEIDRFWEQVPLATDEDRMLFALAVSEVATNIVQHSQARTTTTVQAEVRAAADSVLAEIRDDAKPAAIEWSAVGMPDAESESGRGLAIAQAALDVFEHEYDGQRNVWTLRRRLSGEA